MFKNVSSQYVGFHAYNTTSHLPVNADTANILVKLTKDFGAPVAASGTVTAVTSVGFSGGLYKIDLTKAETNYDCLIVAPTSATATTVIDPQIIYTVPANFTALSIDTSGWVDIDQIEGTDLDINANGTVGATLKSPRSRVVSLESL
jgi:hypothetical protein